MQLDEIGGDSQPQTSAFRSTTGSCQANEGFKDTLLLFGRNALAIVADFNSNLVIDLTRGESDAATFRGELDGVADQVGEHLPKPQGVGANMQISSGLLEKYLRFLFRQRVKSADHFGKGRRDRHILAGNLHLAGFDFGKVKDIAD